MLNTLVKKFKVGNIIGDIMSLKTSLLTLTFGIFISLPAAAQVANDNGGFGQPFANSGHAGFETPSTFEDDGSNLQDIEPAAGEEKPKHGDSGLVPVTESQGDVIMLQDDMIEIDVIDTLGP